MTVDLALLVAAAVGWLAGWLSRWQWSEHRWEEPEEEEIAGVVHLNSLRHRIP